MRDLYFYLLVVVLGVGCGRVDYKNCRERSSLYDFFHSQKVIEVENDDGIPKQNATDGHNEGGNVNDNKNKLLTTPSSNDANSEEEKDEKLSINEYNDIIQEEIEAKKDYMENSQKWGFESRYEGDEKINWDLFLEAYKLGSKIFSDYNLFTKYYVAYNPKTDELLPDNEAVEILKGSKDKPYYFHSTSGAYEDIIKSGVIVPSNGLNQGACVSSAKAALDYGFITFGLKLETSIEYFPLSFDANRIGELRFWECLDLKKYLHTIFIDSSCKCFGLYAGSLSAEDIKQNIERLLKEYNYDDSIKVKIIGKNQRSQYYFINRQDYRIILFPKWLVHAGNMYFNKNSNNNICNNDTFNWKTAKTLYSNQKGGMPLYLYAAKARAGAKVIRD